MLLRLLATDVDLRDAVSTFVGEDISALPKQHQLDALRSYQQVGSAISPLVMTARLRREAIEEAAYARGEIARADRIALLEAEVADLRERLTEKKGAKK